MELNPPDIYVLIALEVCVNFLYGYLVASYRSKLLINVTQENAKRCVELVLRIHGITYAGKTDAPRQIQESIIDGMPNNFLLI